ncbi:DUF4350 domain-containing protein [Haloplanus aerogenes]|uniref:DUF4350 domain-containing protein n=1 Tax=Haloplanus aerogenes TaxID=660522 RepID=A0A3M0DR54_9EURY|nr:DUF4350 domain-containing protein [Haloplanus aerogenes]AZH24395.1 hypothetical protein DU502_02935 [Haloplanus aerogenes]RMB23964.1 hypothetical protein ATH50_1196 [Haloplanus aerogenes]
MSAPKSRLAVVFVVIVAAIVGGAAVAPYALGSADDGDSDPVSVENQQFQPGTILPDETTEEGEISMESDATGKTVLVDVGHENGISKTQLEPLLSTLVENGHQIRFYRGQRQSLNESLRSADAFLVASPQRRYTSDELAGVEAFTDAGGRVLVMGDPPSVQASGGLLFGLGSLQPTAPRTTALGSTYGVAYGSGYLYNMDENDNNYKSIYARPTADTDLTAGVDRVVMREAVPLRTTGATRALVGTDGTHLSTTRDPGQYAVLARSGNVTAVGDTDFVTRENAYDADNDVLIGNLADFLVSGDKRPGAPRPPGADQPQRPPAGGESGGGGQPTPPPTPAPA